MRLENLQEGDAEAIFAILQKVYKSPQFPMGGTWSLQNLYRELERGFGLGYFQERRLTAFIVYQAVPGATDISVLATHPEFLRQGLMEKLLLELIRKRVGFGPIWLEVHEANDAARKLYEKLGFHSSGRRPAYYRDGASAILYSYG